MQRIHVAAEARRGGQKGDQGAMVPKTMDRRNKKHLKNVGPIRHCEPPHAHSPGVVTVARRLRIDVHDNDDNDNNNDKDKA